MEHEDAGEHADSGDTAAPPEGEPAERTENEVPERTERLSLTRLLIALVVTAAAVVATVYFVQHRG